MTQIEQIKAEIERRRKKHKELNTEFPSLTTMARIEECEYFLSFIESFEKEDPIDAELGAIARHFFAIKDHLEDARLDEGEIRFLERIGYPERVESTPKIKGWVARDSYKDKLQIFERKPRREGMNWEYGYWRTELPKELFPELKWKDEPIEVELTIRKV